MKTSQILNDLKIDVREIEALLIGKKICYKNVYEALALVSYNLSAQERMSLLLSEKEIEDFLKSRRQAKIVELESE